MIHVPEENCDWGFRHCDDYIDDEVGITKDLRAEHGYFWRVAVSDLSNFSETER